VLAVAVLGSVALFHFGAEVRLRVEPLGLPAAAVADLQTEAARLGEASVPISVPSGQRQEVEMVLRGAFVDTYRLMMLLCMALAAISAVLSAFMIGKRGIQPAEERKKELLSRNSRSIRPVSQETRR